MFTSLTILLFSYIDVCINLFENINFPDLLHKWKGFFRCDGCNYLWKDIFVYISEWRYPNYHFKFNRSMFKNILMLVSIAFLLFKVICCFDTEKISELLLFFSIVYKEGIKYLCLCFNHCNNWPAQLCKSFS